MVAGLFYDHDSAERASHSLFDRGYDIDDFNLVMSDETWQEYLSATEKGMLEAVIAAIAATRSMTTLPELGVVIAGPLVASVAGAHVTAGGLLGALLGGEGQEERAKDYENNLQEGGILMGVTPHSEEDASYFEEQWRQHSGRKIRSQHTLGASSRTSS